jgi:hypothetical protein
LARRNWIQEQIIVFFLGSWPSFQPAQVRPNIIPRHPWYSWRAVFGGIVEEEDLVRWLQKLAESAPKVLKEGKSLTLFLPLGKIRRSVNQDPR